MGNSQEVWFAMWGGGPSLLWLFIQHHLLFIGDKSKCNLKLYFSSSLMPTVFSSKHSTFPSHSIDLIVLGFSRTARKQSSHHHKQCQQHSCFHPQMTNLVATTIRSFSSRITGCENLDRLKLLHIYSQERRREQFQIIFIWKILQGYVQGYSLHSASHPRRGRTIQVSDYHPSAPASVRRAREASLSVKGAQLFNLLPRDIRDISTGSVENFKSRLDDWLESMPDQPTVPGRQRAATTNSLIDQVQLN